MNRPDSCIILSMADLHYNAFISYRHKPRDIEVAQEIQKQLERFHIPKDLRKKYGIERIERVFRDKEELPTTANLSDDIENALNNSDYLIVICTPATKESRWIEREINLFLEHHEQSKVMTVLAEGEPGDVIPKRLLERKKTVTDQEGNQIEITEELEPLSCDYRMDFRKARKTELPRLLSVIIGCSYDELMRRRQQYMMRRIGIISAIVVSALAVFIAYLIYSRNQIHANYVKAEENLRQSRINQSKFLSSSSLEALGRFDSILAIQLAYEAMPKENDPRPLTSEAEYALSSALGLYSIGGVLDFSAARQFETDAEIKSMIINKDGSAMAVLDSDNKLYLWNLKTRELLLEKVCELGSSVYEADERGFLLVSDDHIALLSWQDGSEIFVRDEPLQEYRFSFDRENGFASCFDGTSYFRMDLSGNRYDPVDASLLSFSENYMPDKSHYFPDRHLLVSTASETGTFTNNAMEAVLYDYQDRIRTRIDRDFHTIEEVCELKNGDLLFIDYENTYLTSTVTMNNGTAFYDMAVTISSFNPETHRENWSETLHYNQAGGRQYKLFENDNGKQFLLVSLSNIQVLMDPESGEILHRIEWPDNVIEVINAKEDFLLSILSDGSFAAGYPDKSSPDTAIRHLIPDLVRVKTASPDGETTSFMVVTSGGNRVIQFDSKLTSSAYSSLFPLDNMSVFYSAFEGDLLAVQGKKDDSYLIRVYDLSKDEQLTELSLKEPGFASLGFLSDGRLYHIHNGSDLLAGELNDPVNGTAEEIRIDSSEYTPVELIKAVQNDTLFYAGKTSSPTHLIIGRKNLIDGTSAVFDTPIETDIFLKEIHPLTDHHVLISYTDKSISDEFRLLLADLETKTIHPLAEVSDDRHFNPAGDDTRFAIRTAKGIQIYDYAAEPVQTIPLSINTVPSFAFHDSDLFVLTTDGMIQRYDPEGTLRSMYEGESDAQRSPADSCLWLFKDNTLKLFSGGLCEVFDLSQRKCRLSAANVLAYDEAKNRILVKRSDTDSRTEIGAFRIFSPEELVEEAVRTVGDIPISEEVRNRYGLD